MWLAVRVYAEFVIIGLSANGAFVDAPFCTRRVCVLTYPLLNGKSNVVLKGVEGIVQWINIGSLYLGVNSSGYGFFPCIPYKIQKKNAQCEHSIWFWANGVFENTSEFCRVDTIVCVSKPLNLTCSETIGVFNESDKNGDNKQHAYDFLFLG